MRKCVIADLSDGGVKLMVGDPREISSQFVLLPSREASTGRRCRVKWRNGTHIGAEFVG
jgi:hypothetical protein